MVRCAHCQVKLKEPSFAPCFGPYTDKELCSTCHETLMKSRWYRFRLSLSYHKHRTLFFIFYFLSAFKPRRKSNEQKESH